MQVPNRYRFAHARLPDGWKQDVLVTIDNETIIRIETDVRDTDAVAVSGAAVPGMPNVHSHAFQRAMAGLAEARSAANESFWTWRETMYALAQRMTPELLNAVASQLYVEMLKAGYTRVCEFHYLHHQADGSPYQDRSIMSDALLDAASSTAIGMTLLPTLYQTSDFGEKPPSARQRQFVMRTEEFVQLIEGLRAKQSSVAQIGLAIHSLRAVPPSALDQLLASSAAKASAAIHIHIAEQEREVAECVRQLGRRPIDWLLEHAPVNERWCLVHATHASPDELNAMAASGAVVGLCPTTEANLGDGVFALPEFLERGGRFGIGSDSHISISATEELRWLEYQSRLARRERNVLATANESSGARLWTHACAAGAQAAGIRAGQIAEGHRADLIVLDADGATLIGRTDDALLDTFIFSGQPNPVRDVMVGGRWVVQDGRHFAEIPIAAGFKRAMRALFP
jgi:formimidoylglutamate deiminase